MSYAFFKATQTPILWFLLTQKLRAFCLLGFSPDQDSTNQSDWILSVFTSYIAIIKE